MNEACQRIELTPARVRLHASPVARRIERERRQEMVLHAGTCQSYIEDLKKRKDPEADQPHRVVYEQLVRPRAGAVRL